MNQYSSAGRPTLISRVGIFDENDNEVPIGNSAEICVRSPTVFLGYWGREDENARVFRNGWHYTGDICRFDEKGYLWYVKQKQEKELIKSGRENVYPVEVEKAILEHEAIKKEVCVIGVPVPDWGEATKAICTLMPGSTLEVNELVEFVGSRIARYKKA
jgi:long-chain acyl-CoA synthetase